MEKVYDVADLFEHLICFCVMSDRCENEEVTKLKFGTLGTLF